MCWGISLLGRSHGTMQLYFPHPPLPPLVNILSYIILPLLVLILQKYWPPNYFVWTMSSCHWGYRERAIRLHFFLLRQWSAGIYKVIILLSRPVTDNLIFCAKFDLYCYNTWILTSNLPDSLLPWTSVSHTHAVINCHMKFSRTHCKLLWPFLTKPSHLWRQSNLLLFSLLAQTCIRCEYPFQENFPPPQKEF